MLNARSLGPNLNSHSRGVPASAALFRDQHRNLNSRSRAWQTSAALLRAEPLIVISHSRGAPASAALFH